MAQAHVIQPFRAALSCFKHKTVPSFPTSLLESFSTFQFLYWRKQGYKNHPWWITGTLNFMVFYRGIFFPAILAFPGCYCSQFLYFLLSQYAGTLLPKSLPSCPLMPLVASQKKKQVGNPSAWHFGQKRINTVLHTLELRRWPWRFYCKCTNIYTITGFCWQASTARCVTTTLMLGHSAARNSRFTPLQDNTRAPGPALVASSTPCSEAVVGLVINWLYNMKSISSLGTSGQASPSSPECPDLAPRVAQQPASTDSWRNRSDAPHPERVTRSFVVRNTCLNPFMWEALINQLL